MGKLQFVLSERRSRERINQGSPHPHPSPTIGLSWEPGEASTFNLVQIFHYDRRLDLLISGLRLFCDYSDHRALVFAKRDHKSRRSCLGFFPRSGEEPTLQVQRHPEKQNRASGPSH